MRPDMNRNKIFLTSILHSEECGWLGPAAKVGMNEFGDKCCPFCGQKVSPFETEKEVLAFIDVEQPCRKTKPANRVGNGNYYFSIRGERG